MNPLPPNTDELVSAYLDGQATADEVVIVESNPELMERVDALRGITELLGSEPAPAPAAQKEAHISAALDAFDSLFASATDSTETTSDSATTESEAPRLQAVPTTPQAPAAETSASAPIVEDAMPDGVTSLAAARERRRPRRFNAGIIAAAAAMVLFVALAAFGLGGGQDSFDTASTSLEANVVAADTADAMDDDAIEMEAAMAEPSSGSALSEIAPAATPQAPAITMQEVEEEAAMDEEAMGDAMDDSMAEADSAVVGSAAAPADALSIEPIPLFVGDFPDQETLRRELELLPTADLAERAALVEPGLFSSCQQEIPELADIESSTLIAEAFVTDQLVEIHQIVDGDNVTIILVDPVDCSVIPETP